MCAVRFLRYFVGGYVYNWKMHGKEGQDRIPHVEFWQDLPSLVMDGIRYSAYLVKLASAHYTGSTAPERPRACEGVGQTSDTDDLDRAPLLP